MKTQLASINFLRIPLLIALWGISLPALSQQTLLSGKIKNSNASSITFVYRVFPSFKLNHYEVALDKSGAFYIRLTIEDPVEGWLQLAQEHVCSAYLEPGDTLTIQLDAKNAANTTFAGNRSKENTFLNKIRDAYADLEREDWLRQNGTQEQYHHYVDSLTVSHLKLLSKTFPEYPDLSGVLVLTSNNHNTVFRIDGSPFVKKFYYDEKFRALNMKLRFVNTLWYYQKKQMDPNGFEGTFLNPDTALVGAKIWKQEFNLIDDALVSEDYMQYVKSYVSHKLNRISEGVYWISSTSALSGKNSPLDSAYSGNFEVSIPEQQYFVSKMCLKGRTRLYALAAYVCEAFENRTFEEALPIYEKFKIECYDKALLEKVTNIYLEAKKFKRGNPAPAFVLEDINGKQVPLDDFKGKVIYLDFWASWCAPCIQNMEYAKKLKQEFKDEPSLVFLYISLDEDKTKWKNSIKKHQIEGVHLRAPKGFADPVCKAYQLMSVPKYVLIDRNGNIFNFDAPNPWMYNSIEKIREALK